ncbi:Zn-ribbon domain-containing OB-fold protein [Streptomyces rhizosphaericus]|uniref:Zn-ribbon domain-containing OB-fold protein n=1 Tax=Streptomyces rhizosphaericus TaxID=114699 RepID=A0A6G4AJZ4_9ACTN|nr:OB-fold domain-containing protein [Streptomyces rhizosphaericus]NEW72951.1 hypothetical protein [Streptomyces rhizosphaericus]
MPTPTTGPDPYQKVIDPVGPHVEGLKEGRLLVARCAGCGHVSLPMRPVCGRCATVGQAHWIVSSGRGRLWSFAEFHKTYSSTFKLAAPYVVAVIELEEGALIYGNVDAPYADLEVAMPVTARFEDTGHGRELIFTTE